MRVNVDNHVGTSVLRLLNAPDATTADLPANHLVMHQQYIRDRSDIRGSAIRVPAANHQLEQTPIEILLHEARYHRIQRESGRWSETSAQAARRWC